jgi:surface polysaccharide O-acyltransferase-like enzyme
MRNHEDVCSTVLHLQHCVTSAALCYVCSTVLRLPHCVTSAALCYVCSTVLLSVALQALFVRAYFITVQNMRNHKNVRYACNCVLVTLSIVVFCVFCECVLCSCHLVNRNLLCASPSLLSLYN